jgi:hypothetical protein
MFSNLCLLGAAGTVSYPMLEQFAHCFAIVPASGCCLQLCLPLSYNLLLNSCTASHLCAAVRMQPCLLLFRFDFGSVCIAQWLSMANSNRELSIFQC